MLQFGKKFVYMLRMFFYLEREREEAASRILIDSLTSHTRGLLESAGISDERTWLQEHSGKLHELFRDSFREVMEEERQRQGH